MSPVPRPPLPPRDPKDVLLAALDGLGIGGTEAARAEDVVKRIEEICSDPVMQHCIIEGFAFALGHYAAHRRGDVIPPDQW